MRMVFISTQRTSVGSDPVRAGTPTGLLSLAAMVRKHVPETETHLIDALVEGKNITEIRAGIFRHGLVKVELKARLERLGIDKGDVIAISNLHTSEWMNAALCARIAKEVDPEISVVLGGHHPTYQPRFMLENTMADYIVLGEGEYPFIDLVKALAEGKKGRQDLEAIKGLAFRTERGVVQTGHGRVAKHLDELEDPAYALLMPDLYQPTLSHWGKAPDGGPIIDFMASRGCPMDCTFCTSTDMWGKRMRTFSPERIKKQLQSIKALGFGNLSVEDDQVLLLPKETKDAMFGELGRLGINWVIDAGLHYPDVTEEFVGQIAANGCYRVFQPIEHPALEIMHNEGKYRTLKTQVDVRAALVKAFSMYNKAGIGFYIAIMVGFTGETRETLQIVRDYAKFVKDQGAKWINFFFAKPLPGTRDYAKYAQVPQERRWEYAPHFWTFSTPVLKPHALGLDELWGVVNDISLEVNGRENSLVDPSAD